MNLMKKDTASHDDQEKEFEQKLIKTISKLPDDIQNRFKALKILSVSFKHSSYTHNLKG
jgi:hypothetical protein